MMKYCCHAEALYRTGGTSKQLPRQPSQHVNYTKTTKVFPLPFRVRMHNTYDPRVFKRQTCWTLHQHICATIPFPADLQYRLHSEPSVELPHSLQSGALYSLLCMYVAQRCHCTFRHWLCCSAWLCFTLPLQSVAPTHKPSAYGKEHCTTANMFGNEHRTTAIKNKHTHTLGYAPVLQGCCCYWCSAARRVMQPLNCPATPKTPTRGHPRCICM